MTGKQILTGPGSGSVRACARSSGSRRTTRPTLATQVAAPGRGHGLHGLDAAGDEGGLHLADGIVNRNALTFVEDLDAEDLGRAHRAVLVGAGEGHVEGQDLIAVPGRGQFVQTTDFSQRQVVDLVDDRPCL